MLLRPVFSFEILKSSGSDAPLNFSVGKRVVVFVVLFIKADCLQKSGVVNGSSLS